MASQKANDGKGKLTGKHVLMWVLGFFGVMFIANGFFVYYANTSWPGVEVESSFKEGQIYDQKLEAAREQEQRAWHMDAQLKRRQNDVFLVVVAKDKLNNPLLDLSIKAEVGRPVNELNDQKVEMEHKGEGVYQSKLGSLDTGRWRIKLEAYEKDVMKFKSVGQTTLN